MIRRRVLSKTGGRTQNHTNDDLPFTSKAPMRPTGRIVTSPEICLDSSSKSDIRWFALLAAIAASVLLAPSLRYRLTLQGSPLRRPTSAPQRAGSVHALHH